MVRCNLLISFLVVFIIGSIPGQADAQLRDDILSRQDYSGPLIQVQTNEVGNWSNLFNMKMSHSYSLSFGSFAGNTYNINDYTNTMQFFFSEKLTGRLDLSILHSPFGNSLISGTENNLGTRFMIKNAELNYRFGERSNLRIQFQQHPFPYGGISPYSPYYRDSFGRPYYY